MSKESNHDLLLIEEKIHMDKREIVNTLKALKPDLFQHKVREIGLFGSCVRDEQQNTSDIDVLIDFDDDASLFDQSRRFFGNKTSLQSRCCPQRVTSGGNSRRCNKRNDSIMKTCPKPNHIFSNF